MNGDVALRVVIPTNAKAMIACIDAPRKPKCLGPLSKSDKLPVLDVAAHRDEGIMGRSLKGRSLSQYFYGTMPYHNEFRAR